MLQDKKEAIEATALETESVQKTLEIKEGTVYIAKHHECYSPLKEIILRFGYQYLREQGVRYSDNSQNNIAQDNGGKDEENEEDDDSRIELLLKMLRNRRRA